MPYLYRQIAKVIKGKHARNLSIRVKGIWKLFVLIILIIRVVWIKFFFSLYFLFFFVSCH